MPASGPGLWANVADSPGLAEKWEIDARKLVAKMRACSVAEKIAIVEANETFWRHHQLETPAALALALRRKK